MIEVNSFAQLRTTAPTKSGDIAMLTRYYDKDSTFRGGGLFVGFVQTKDLPADDGGTVALDAGKKFFWKRIIDDPEQINLFHFGGRCDGKTDDSDAFMRNFLWSKNYESYSDALGVRIPTGQTFIKPLDFTGLGELPVFAIYGDVRAKGGWRPRVRIISDKSDATVFKVNARRVIMQGFTWNGQCTADVNNIKGAVMPAQRSNNQPFFENICQTGEFCNIFAVRIDNNGGTGLKFIDTLDTKLDQIYSSKSFGSVIEVKYSNNPAGGWNHSTAISLQNSNFQNGYGPALLDMPRLTQGLIRNVWIEHTRFPGNLDNGQWVIEALSIESSDNPLCLDNTRCVIDGAYFQGQGTMTCNRVAGSWLSGYEKGWIRRETYGVEMNDASFRAGYFTGYKLTNTTPEDKWFYVGHFTFPKMNQVWEIEFLSKRDGAAANAKLEQPCVMNGVGKRRINLQRCASPAKVYADMQQEGMDAIVDVRYQRVWGDGAKVWVKLAKNCGDVIFNLTTTGPTRFEAGQCTAFSSDYSPVADADLQALLASFTKGGDFAVPQNRFSLHNGLAGIGANEQGVLTMQTAVAAAPLVALPAGYVTVNINGVDRKVAYF